MSIVVLFAMIVVLAVICMGCVHVYQKSSDKEFAFIKAEYRDLFGRKALRRAMRKARRDRLTRKQTTEALRREWVAEKIQYKRLELLCLNTLPAEIRAQYNDARKDFLYRQKKTLQEFRLYAEREFLTHEQRTLLYIED